MLELKLIENIISHMYYSFRGSRLGGHGNLGTPRCHIVIASSDEAEY